MSADRKYSFPDAPSPKELADFDLNDLGNTKRLMRLAGVTGLDEDEPDLSQSRLLFLLGHGWVGYNGRYWDKKFGDLLAHRLAHQVAAKVRGLFQLLVERGLTTKDAMKFIDGVGSSGSTSAMLRMATAYLTVEITAFDQDPMTLNCRNGTLRLRRRPEGADGPAFSVTMSPHDPHDRITRFIDIDYDSEAKAPLFESTVAASLSDPDVAAFFKRAMGYSATGLVHEQAIFMCQGLGRDGKSTLLDAIREMLGGYGAVGVVSTFLDQGPVQASGASPDIVKLTGDVRLVILSEPPRTAKLNEGLLKAWASGSPITARELHQKPFEFRPIGKLWIECNAFPAARGDDDGLWRRIHPIMFQNQVPIEQVDRTLPEKLRKEFPGILNWVIAGVGDWLAQGLDPPERVRKALDDYRKQSSPFSDWMNERCIWGKAAVGQRTLSSELYADYKDWAEAQGHDKPMSQRSFGDALHQRQILIMGKNTAGKKYRGPIRLKNAQELMDDQAKSEAAAKRASGAEAGVQSGGFDPNSYDIDDGGVFE